MTSRFIPVCTENIQCRGSHDSSTKTRLGPNRTTLLASWSDKDVRTFYSNNKNTFTIYWDMDLLTLYGIDKEGNKMPFMEPSNRLLERLYIGKTN